MKELLNKLRACGSLDCDAARQIFRLFPELKKSEDELIKEELIHFLETCRDTHLVGNRKRDEWIAWLEKQGERKSDSKVESKFKVGDFIVYNNNGDVCQVTEIKDDTYCIWLFMLK